MPIYYRHLREGDDLIRDVEGTHFKDVEAVRLEAIRCAREIIAAGVLSGLVDLSPTIHVDDQDGKPVLSLPFSDAFRVVR